MLQFACFTEDIPMTIQIVLLVFCVLSITSMLNPNLCHLREKYWGHIFQWTPLGTTCANKHVLKRWTKYPGNLVKEQSIANLLICLSWFEEQFQICLFCLSKWVLSSMFGVNWTLDKCAKTVDYLIILIWHCLDSKCTIWSGTGTI